MNIAKNITGIQHIGIPTNDIEKSIEFYQRLGFEVAYKTINKASNEKVAFLKMKNLMIETYENGNAEMKLGSIDHIALDVTNIDHVYQEIKSAGYTMLDDAVQYLPFWENGVKFFTIVGPNEEKIEFAEKLNS